MDLYVFTRRLHFNYAHNFGHGLPDVTSYRFGGKRASLDLCVVERVINVVKH